MNWSIFLRRITLVAAALFCTSSLLTAQQHTIKFATIAPKGSTWMNVMEEYDAALRKESGGRLGFKIFAGGVQGDELNVLRKVRINQLQSAGFTGVGMGEIAPEVRILDSPFLVRNHKEMDFLYETFNDEFAGAFEKNGFVLLGWAEVGFVHVFTNTPINKPEDLRGLKLWTWEGDPVADAAFKALDINPIPLSITDVLQSLQTGLIDAVYSPPLAMIALQWFTRVKYMVETPITNSTGALLISKRSFDSLPADLQEILLRNGKKYMRKLTELSRRDNEIAFAELQKRNIKMLNVAPKDLEYFTAKGIAARKSLVGRQYSQELLTRVENALEQFRKNGGK